MRVAMLTYSVKPRGGVVHAIEVSEALARRGHEVELMALARPGEQLFRSTTVPVRLVRHTPLDAPFDLRIEAMLEAYAEGLRPLLSRGDAPRVVIVSSSASLGSHDEAIAAACLDGDENRARLLAAADTEDDANARLGPIYAATKRAVSRWIRRTAPRVEWAGAGILLNGVAPGLVVTPMTAPMLATPEGRDVLARAVPRAVADPAQPRDLALLLAFLASPDNRYLVGQVPFCDGGTDVIVRGDAFF